MHRYNPTIKLWGFIYFKDDIVKVDDKITKLVERFAASGEEKIDMREYLCKLTGAIYDHEYFDDGEIVVTSFVDEIDRVDDDYLVVKTKSGSWYYISADEKIDP